MLISVCLIPLRVRDSRGFAWASAVVWGSLPLVFLACSPRVSVREGPRYEPTWESINAHQVPEWFEDAKLGIFVHWGLYSVPGWAPLTPERNSEKQGATDGEPRFVSNPYAEWYMNSLRIENSPTARYHAKTYGKDFDYLDFAKIFNQEIVKWNPNAWAQLFSEVGARYVVLTTKHHDGFTLWPSRIHHPHRSENHQGVQRDLVGELTEAVRAKRMRMGVYYSGGLDWGFTHEPIKSLKDFLGCVPQTKEYADFADAQWRELIKRYDPSVLWNDIGHPKRGDIRGIFAAYFNQRPDGVVNNRCCCIRAIFNACRWR